MWKKEELVLEDGSPNVETVHEENQHCTSDYLGEWPLTGGMALLLFFFSFFFFTKNEGKNWFADWLIELACYRKNIRIFVSFFSHFFLPTSPTLLISPLVICYVLFHDARFPGWFIFLGSNARLLCKLLQVQQKIKGLFTWRQGTPGRWGNRLRSGNPPVHITSHFNLITFTW